MKLFTLIIVIFLLTAANTFAHNAPTTTKGTLSANVLIVNPDGTFNQELTQYRYIDIDFSLFDFSQVLIPNPVSLEFELKKINTKIRTTLVTFLGETQIPVDGNLVWRKAYQFHFNTFCEGELNSCTGEVVTTVANDFTVPSFTYKSSRFVLDDGMVVYLNLSLHPRY
jgi:hypothetical protein